MFQSLRETSPLVMVTGLGAVGLPLWAAWQAGPAAAWPWAVGAALLAGVLALGYLIASVRRRAFYDDAERDRAARFSTAELACRLPVWDALSELWLDRKPTQGELRFIGQRLAQSKYSLAELEAICLSEVAPVVHLNLARKTGGEQIRFETAWLQDAILRSLDRHGRARLSWRDHTTMTREVAREWDQVKAHIEDYHALGV